MQIFFDLDGTLIDAKDRLYQLFQYLVPFSALTFDEYWNLKRQQINHAKILHSHFSCSEAQIRTFERNWLNQIEATEWLQLDKPFEGITEKLLQISELHDLYIVTSRQFDKPLFSQLEQFGWTKLFKKVFVTNHSKAKSELIREYVHTTMDDWFVGDTGVDIQQGKLLGVRTVGVLSGFRNRESLEHYSPNYIFDKVTDINFLIK